MTKLGVIETNHLVLECRCGHSKLVSVADLLKKLSPEMTVKEVAARAKCSHCDTQGVETFRIITKVNAT
jgi:hypothetical protein